MDIFRDICELLISGGGDHLQDYWRASIARETIGEPVNSVVEMVTRRADEVLLAAAAADTTKHGPRPMSCEFLVACEALLDYSWEQLNTGHWNCVPLDWRHLYAWASLWKVLFKLDGLFGSPSDVIIAHQQRDQALGMELLRICDMGLIMCPPIRHKNVDNLLATIATRLHASLIPRDSKKLSGGSPPGPRLPQSVHYLKKKFGDPIERVKAENCDIFNFYYKYYTPGIPVIIENGLVDWPAMGTGGGDNEDQEGSRGWSLDYLMNVAAFRTFPVEIGSKYTDKNWSQKLMTLKEFIERFITRSEVDHDRHDIGYIAQHNLFDQVPELRAGFSLPDFCSLYHGMLNETGDHDNDRSESPPHVDINCWFGPEGTVSPLHYDDKDNLLAQVFGSKYVRLYSRDLPATDIYPHPSPLLHNTSQVDVESVDPNRFPHLSRVPHREAILRPSDLLFIPAREWHFVRSLDTSLSISFWWK